MSEGIYIDEDDIEEGERLSKDYAVYVGNWKSQKMKVAVKSSSLNLQEKQTKQEVCFYVCILLGVQMYDL